MNQEPSRYNEPPRSPATPEVEPTPQPVRVSPPRSAPYVTYSIIAITVFFYALQLASQFLLQRQDLPAALLMKNNEAIELGQWWRLLTPALMHGSIMHIAFNMYALLSFGTGLERHFGHGRFFLLYILSAFACVSVLQLLIERTRFFKVAPSSKGVALIAATWAGIVSAGAEWPPVTPLRERA